jgi:hypothetical protein
MILAFESPLLKSFKADSSLDVEGYMEFEFRSRAPVRPGVFHDLATSGPNLLKALATNTSSASVPALMAFLDIERRRSNVYFLKVMSALSERDIDFVVKRGYDGCDSPRLAHDATLRDLMTFLLRIDSLFADRAGKHLVPASIHRTDAFVTEAIRQSQDADLADVLSMVTSFFTEMSAKDAAVRVAAAPKMKWLAALAAA